MSTRFLLVAPSDHESGLPTSGFMAAAETLPRVGESVTILDGIGNEIGRWSVNEVLHIFVATPGFDAGAQQIEVSLA